jgi:carboxyl-terminal processing protease
MPSRQQTDAPLIPGVTMLTQEISCKFAGAAVLCVALASFAWSQPITSFERDRAQAILQVIASDVRKHYYDPKLHGLDWDAKVAEIKQKIATAQSFNMAMSHVAALLDALDDSHTFFLPPQHSYRHDYGWQYQMIGSACYVIRVRPKSDAETKGLKAGDQILAINGYAPSRDNLWKIQYVFNILRPQASLRLNIRTPAGDERQLDVLAEIHEHKKVTDLTGGNAGNDIWDLVREEETEAHRMQPRAVEMGDELMILRLPLFGFTEVDRIIDKARKHKALIVDLRGNPGGGVEMLRTLVGGVFEKEVKICDRVGRKENKPMVAKPRHNPFTGKLVVLVDSRSASASEVFARVVQIEKRGMVVGDSSSGSVMESQHYEEKNGTTTVVFYGASITDADLIMADGKSLEHTGVIPNEPAVPTAADLASGRDPVLAHAAEALGVKLSAEDAGKMFPYEWAPKN